MTTDLATYLGEKYGKDAEYVAPKSYAVDISMISRLTDLLGGLARLAALRTNEMQIVCWWPFGC